MKRHWLVCDRHGLVHFAIYHAYGSEVPYLTTPCYCGESFHPSEALDEATVTCLECYVAPAFHDTYRRP